MVLYGSLKMTDDSSQNTQGISKVGYEVVYTV